MNEVARGLAFSVGTHGVVVPASLVERVVEAELSPSPPLGRAWVGGFGVSDGGIFVAIDLLAGRAGSPAHLGVQACVLLETGTRSGLQWALRVTRALGFVDLAQCARPVSMPAEWPAWVGGAQLGDKSIVGLLDVVGMLRDFGA